MVLNWPYHKAYRCRKVHDDGGWNCSYCAGGLFSCVRCGAAEGELPTHCPGVLLETAERAAILNGHLDYRGGRWVGASNLAALTIEEIRSAEWYEPC